MLRLRNRALLILLAWFFAVGSARATEVHWQILRSTGWVVTSKEDGRTGVATCWVIDREKKLAITNCHVVRHVKEFKIYFPHYRGDRLLNDSKFYSTEAKAVTGHVLASDPRRDLALLELTEIPEGVQSLSLAKQTVQSGQTVHTVGNSGAAGKSLVDGVLWRCRSGKVQKVFFGVKALDEGQRLEARLIETKLGIAPGDSGGPLVNDAGELVGVVSAYSREDKGVDFSVELEELREFVTRKSKPAPQATVLGSWTLLFQHQGQQRALSLTLRQDGSCIIDGERIFAGRYQYSGNHLTLVVPGLKINDRVPVSWEDNDLFRFRAAGVEFLCNRR